MKFRHRHGIALTLVCKPVTKCASWSAAILQDLEKQRRSDERTKSDSEITPSESTEFVELQPLAAIDDPLFQPHTWHGWVNGDTPFEFLGFDMQAPKK